MARVDGGRSERSSKRDKPAGPRTESPATFSRVEPKPPEAGNGADRAENGGQKPAPPKKSSSSRRPVVLLTLAIIAIAGVAAGIWYWSYSRQFETTDDAFIDAHITTISPKVAGLAIDIPPDVDDNRR